MKKLPCVSHETIYKIIRQDRGHGGNLYKHARYCLKRRKRPAGSRIAIKNRVYVDRRPDAYIKNIYTITDNNGTEFAVRQTVAKALKTNFFFTHPYSSREKGLIENTDKLIRQYIPERANFNDFNERQIKDIQYEINNRPGEKLNSYSPKEIFFILLQNNVASTPAPFRIIFFVNSFFYFCKKNNQ